MIELKKLELEGAPPLYYRPGTSDETIISVNMGQECEYIFPENVDPKVIFDVGANIGVISALMANLYPDAKIYAFEPMPENYEILLKNVAEYPNVIPRNVALGDVAGDRTLYFSEDETNFGGCSFFEPGANKQKSVTVRVANTADEVRAVGGSVDMIKIDSEGSEAEILMGFSLEQIDKVTWILGELHGTRDLELLQYLQDKRFGLAFAKPMQSRIFHFYAQRLPKKN